ncbi:multidrug effflux MFS transporter [Paracoccus sp. 1_MG-2023]|uniref:multidrug effflux MFS transporter n=1 Tax=unclassified Paracoccus (in: a-proteobacteria) TaxID=2688777 RepID=UPI001C09BCDB|nr:MULTISPECIES: multidrug effflux MFS transporter [unclassified Paracoccus (in: a-proteobacteria)]MBU2958871.1 multidrug effflux MFS transporter [Paracoccus sp. C2R09]MDO6670267.1 multidrug effflux MFS transporter [Paracoccus sp. 1_MG-2023]
MQIKPPSARRAAAITGTLGLLSLFPPLATDMYLSAMGDLAQSMGTDHTAAEFSLSIFFLGLCVGQLLIGPASDGFGRKLPLIFGTTLFVATSIALPLMNDITVFNTLRFFQAIGASAGMVVGRAVVKDLYHGQKAAQVMTVLVMLLTVGPIVSPTLGSLLLEAFGWRSIFVTMAVISAIALVLTLAILPETLAPEARQKRPFVDGARGIAMLLRRRGFLAMALVAALVQSGMFAFITGSSAVFQGVFGLDTVSFGLMFALVAAALVIFGRVNTLLLRSYRPAQIVRAGLPVFIGAAAILAAISGTHQLWLFILPLWIAIGMVGLLSANAMSIAMDLAPDGAGVGSALLGALQFAIAFGVSSLVAVGDSSTALPMSLGLLLPSLAAGALFFASPRGSAQPVTG